MVRARAWAFVGSITTTTATRTSTFRICGPLPDNAFPARTFFTATNQLASGRSIEATRGEIRSTRIPVMVAFTTPVFRRESGWAAGHGGGTAGTSTMTAIRTSISLTDTYPVRTGMTWAAFFGAK